jgi:hypothetical protein
MVARSLIKKEVSCPTVVQLSTKKELLSPILAQLIIKKELLSLIPVRLRINFFVSQPRFLPNGMPKRVHLPKMAVPPSIKKELLSPILVQLIINRVLLSPILARTVINPQPLNRATFNTMILARLSIKSITSHKVQMRIARSTVSEPGGMKALPSVLLQLVACACCKTHV